MPCRQPSPSKPPVRVDRQRAGPDAMAGPAARTQSEALEGHQHGAGEAAVDLRDVNVPGPDAPATKQVVAQSVGEVARVVVGEHVVSEVEAGTGLGAVA
jgi:hypothetical protein